LGLPQLPGLQAHFFDPEKKEAARRRLPRVSHTQGREREMAQGEASFSTRPGLLSVACPANLL
jgi:hypothetical protein